MDPQLQKVSSQLHRPRTLWASLCFHVAVVVQLCSSDGVEDLLESLAIDSPKSLTYQEPEGHHRVGPAADHLQGEPMSSLSLLLSPLCLPSLLFVSHASSLSLTCLMSVPPPFSLPSLCLLGVSPVSSLVSHVSPQIWTRSWVRVFLRLCSRSSLWLTCRSEMLMWR